jgi:hypothetical protein
MFPYAVIIQTHMGTDLAHLPLRGISNFGQEICVPKQQTQILFYSMHHTYPKQYQTLIQL